MPVMTDGAERKAQVAQPHQPLWFELSVVTAVAGGEAIGRHTCTAA